MKSSTLCSRALLMLLILENFLRKWQWWTCGGQNLSDFDGLFINSTKWSNGRTLIFLTKEKTMTQKWRWPLRPTALISVKHSSASRLKEGSWRSTCWSFPLIISVINLNKYWRQGVCGSTEKILKILIQISHLFYKFFIKFSRSLHWREAPHFTDNFFNRKIYMNKTIS